LINSKSRLRLAGIGTAAVPLTVIEWSRNSAALNIGRHIQRFGILIWRLREPPLHGRHEQQIARLSAATGAIAGVGTTTP
jgi:hypothetical protein